MPLTGHSSFAVTQLATQPDPNQALRFLNKTVGINGGSKEEKRPQRQSQTVQKVENATVEQVSFIEGLEQRTEASKPPWQG